MKFVLDTRGEKTTGKAKNNLEKVIGERTFMSIQETNERKII